MKILNDNVVRIIKARIDDNYWDLQQKFDNDESIYYSELGDWTEFNQKQLNKLKHLLSYKDFKEYSNELKENGLI